MIKTKKQRKLYHHGMLHPLDYPEHPRNHHPHHPQELLHRQSLISVDSLTHRQGQFLNKFKLFE